MKKLLFFVISLILASIICALSIFATENVGVDNLEVEKDGDTITYIYDIENLFGSRAIAKIGDVEFEDLQEAINAAGVGDTIVILKDITVETSASELFRIYEDDKIVIDLNEKTINVTESSAKDFVLFYNFGDLTLKNGTVNLTSTIDRGWGALSDVVQNRGGVLTIESGSYNHLGGTSMAFALDLSGNSYGDAYTTINGGSFVSTYIAIRMRMADTTLNGNPGNGIVSLVVNDGYIYGTNSGIWGQITNAYAEDLGDLGVTGGTVGGGKTAINIASDGYDNIFVGITGEAKIEGVLKGEANDFSISGGSFTQEIPDGFCAVGFKPAVKEDGSYGVAVVSLEDAFTFIGFSVPEFLVDGKTSVAAGYLINHEVLDAYCLANNVEVIDLGCAFGVGGIREDMCTSFNDYGKYTTFNAKIAGINPENEKHITAELAMALYIDLGQGNSYVVEIDGVIALVDVSSVPTVTYKELIEAK